MPFYVENFLGLQAGTPVPVGYYDRGHGAWVPSSNGLVINILSVSNGVASVDVDGNGSPATASELQALNITSGEQQQLATL